MMKLYQKNTANFPRLKTDTLFCDYENSFSYNGIVDETMHFIENFQLLDVALWESFVNQFREKTDNAGSWKGEYWGKMMRGACFVYSCTKNAALYQILSDTVLEMIAAADASGRISTYDGEHELSGWDMWCRKYVLLGMQYFLEICNDNALKEKIVVSMREQADYIIARVGNELGKRPICSTSEHWKGINSASILEPFVRLFAITGEKKYLDFSEHIVACCYTGAANIFALAYENALYPYQYPVTKAYEMISCFEGLLEFYRITENEKHKTAVVNFADKVLESDFTVIGCSGTKHELFDHSSVRQWNPTNREILQETCVTVTLMKFFYQLTLLTGNPKYADAFEISFYNAYLGAVNTEKMVSPVVITDADLKNEPMPFDSYSPLVIGTRGNEVGGFQKIGGGKYYGCCACIGAAGIGLASKMQLLHSENGFALNLFIDGKVTSRLPSSNPVSIETKTAYPADGNVLLTVSLKEPDTFTLLIRNPAWSKHTEASVCGESVKATAGYIRINRLWKNGDTVKLRFDMGIRIRKPVLYETNTPVAGYADSADRLIPYFDRQDESAQNYISLQRGPVMLAQDESLGYALDEPIELRIDEDGCVKAQLHTKMNDLYKCIVAVDVYLEDGRTILLTDYASAGKQKEHGNRIAVWLSHK